jgi:NAD(P)-dependent dehydrogenase (short-subunit alcohol dehydrogenase family)
VNNAGVSAESTVLESSLDDWNWIMGGDFYGMLYGIRAFVPRMIEQDTVEHVVNIASIAGVVEDIDAYHVSKQAGVVEDIDAYHVSKQAAVALTESRYHDLSEQCSTDQSVSLLAWSGQCRTLSGRGIAADTFPQKI